MIHLIYILLGALALLVVIAVDDYFNQDTWGTIARSATMLLIVYLIGVGVITLTLN